MGTRQRLIAATQELLWERGYAATSPRDIQKRAEAGQGSMYHHFAGKQDLAVAALEETAHAMRSDAEALLSTEGTATERVLAYLRRQRDSLRGCRIGRMTYDADVLATPEMVLASLMVATVQGGYVLARAQQDPAAFDAAIGGAADLLRAAAHAHPAATSAAPRATHDRTAREDA